MCCDVVEEKGGVDGRKETEALVESKILRVRSSGAEQVRWSLTGGWNQTRPILRLSGESPLHMPDRSRRSEGASTGVGHCAASNAPPLWQMAYFATFEVRSFFGDSSAQNASNVSSSDEFARH